MKTKIIIEIETKFNKFTGKDFDDEEDDTNFTEDVEEDFHRAVRDYIESSIVDSDEFEEEVLENMKDYDNWLPKKVKDGFNDLGEINIRIT